MNFNEIIAQSKNDSALRLNQLDGIFETAFTDFEKFMYHAGLVVASQDKDNIEQAIQELQGHRMCRPYYLDTRPGVRSSRFVRQLVTQRLVSWKSSDLAGRLLLWQISCVEYGGSVRCKTQRAKFWSC